MKTKTIYQVVVKDSSSKVADWTQEFEHRPSPGDRRLDLPVLEWEDSSETAPIIRLHPFKSHPKTPLETLQEELRQILHKAVELAPC